MVGVMKLATGEAGTAVAAVGDVPQATGAALPEIRTFIRASTTPGKLRLLLFGLVSLCLIWGATAVFVVSVRTSAANNVVNSSEPLTFDAQQIYRALSDADATAARVFLVSGLEPING